MASVAPYIAGIGCRAGCSEVQLRRLLEQTLSAFGLTVSDLDGLASLDHKREEPGLLALAASLGLPVAWFTPAQLQGVSDRLTASSSAALDNVGTPSVAEACALAQVEALSAGRAILRINKHSSALATVAVAGREEAA